ncbi:MAG: PepSY domain-containing protein [Sinobacteraceae bacterium]|nr:PepSY domain-containing protein [Nevskiaceae bacterium]MBV9316877.1 PepSY domain-containing protein [Gammaproteobacteria bacterium]MBV9726557.1 PepSY domain-containing protein [Gammaproteobacteria bacterium]
MWNRTLAAMLALGVMGITGSILSSANEMSGTAVANFMPTARVSLQQGLRAAESQGQPISGKFEVDEGHLQLSVYTAKDGKFSEVLVDQATGKVAKSEAITAGNDLALAQRQLDAYGKARTPLSVAVSHAELANPGYQAVSVTPTVSHGRSVAVVSLLQGKQTRAIAEPLD